jgi:hypothetical protein
MNVVRAPVQTVEEIYNLLRTAVAERRPVEATYERRFRLFCPHRLGRNRRGQVRVLCYPYGGESRSGLEPADASSNWRCIAVEKLSRVTGARCLAHGAESFAPSVLRGGSRISMQRIILTVIRNRGIEAGCG